jgi:hypothetical protein
MDRLGRGVPAVALVDRPNPTGQINGWKNILNVLTMTYGDRLRLNSPMPLTQRIRQTRPCPGSKPSPTWGDRAGPTTGLPPRRTCRKGA